MVVYKFLHDVDRCIDCGGCFVACKDRNQVPVGTSRISLVRVEEGKVGKERYVTISCMHCSKPPCERACPVKAIWKREDGVVLMDKDVCIGCGYCGWACPFGAPKYPHDVPENSQYPPGIMDKCTFCVIPFEQQKDGAGNIIMSEVNPRCVSFCATKARLGGDTSTITETYRERMAARLQERQLVY